MLVIKQCIHVTHVYVCPYPASQTQLSLAALAAHVSACMQYVCTCMMVGKRFGVVFWNKNCHGGRVLAAVGVHDVLFIKQYYVCMYIKPGCVQCSTAAIHSLATWHYMAYFPQALHHNDVMSAVKCISLLYVLPITCGLGNFYSYACSWLFLPCGKLRVVSAMKFYK